MFNYQISLSVLLLGGNTVVSADLMLVDFIKLSVRVLWRLSIVLFNPLCYLFSNIEINFVNI